MLETAAAKMKRLSLWPQGDRGVLIKSYKAIFVKHILLREIMHIFMCLLICSLSSSMAVQWTLLHSLLCAVITPAPKNWEMLGIQ